ncbi:hypothetical protein GCM10009765_76250 [Fodinicola feengrottensis]|uniref:SnoaL-like domain-containing protein n=1 Tax=Fodinicola feengrottensis TaxID=435914 RepID=A0ABN2J1Q3_9ACTN
MRGFEAFWSRPDATLVAPILTDDVVGHWAGTAEPVRGKVDYVGCIAALLEALPDVRLTVAESASSGDFSFVRWIMQATGRRGPFEISGIDRIHTVEGLVDENHVIVDTAAFHDRAGLPIPWAK